MRVDIATHNNEIQRACNFLLTNEDFCEFNIPEMQVLAMLQSNKRTIFLNKRHAAEKNGKIHAIQRRGNCARRDSENQYSTRLIITCRTKKDKSNTK